jgi:type VI secretion system secreted protein VgrG
MTVSADIRTGQTWISKQDNINMFMHLAIWLADNTLLNREYFRLVSIQGHESVSQPFEFELELRANTEVEHDESLDVDQLIGCPITFGINLPAANDNSDFLFEQAITGNIVEQLSLFNGMIASFSMAEPGVYRATVRPDLWKLSLTNQYRLYAQKTICGLIETVLREHAVRLDIRSLSPDTNLALNRVQDWLQAGESDLELITRIMEKAHLYYYFVHTGKTHTMVLANTARYPKIFDAHSLRSDLPIRPLRYTHTNEDPLGLHQFDVITQYQYQKTMTSSSVQAVFSTAEVASQLDSVAAYTSYKPDLPLDKGKLPFNLYRVHSYGGGTGEVDEHAKEQALMLDGSRANLSGSSSCSLMRSCYQFEMIMAQGDDCIPQLVRPNLDGKRFVLTSVKHQCSLDGDYSNQFQAIELLPDTLVTPFELHNTHQGSILAKVVAHGAGVTPGDWRYYDKTNFSANRNTYTSYTTSAQTQEFQGVYVVFSTDPSGAAVWVRIASHMQVIPEINAMVWISRSTDNSEIPEVQSIVQNNGTMTVTPSYWMSNTHVGNNYSTSYSDSKSIRFPYGLGVELAPAVALVEDRYSKGSELAPSFAGANRFREVSYSIGGSFSYSSANYGHDDILNEGHSIGCTYSKSDGKETKSWTNFDLAWSKSDHQVVESYQNISERQYSESTIGSSESHTHIIGRSSNYQTMDGAVISDTTHNDSLSSTSLFNGSVANKTTHNMPVESNTKYAASVINTTLHDAQVTSTTTHNGDVGSTATHNGNVDSRTTHNGGVNSSTTITGTQKSTSKVATSSSTSLIGASTSSSAIGASNNNHAVGVSNNNSATGVAVNATATGISADASVIGARTSISATGVSAELSAISMHVTASTVATSFSSSVISSGFATEIDLRESSKVKGMEITILIAIMVTI